MRGRKPTPVELRKRDGTFRKDRHPEPIKVGATPPDISEPPDHLDETAKEFWRETVPVLAQVGLLSQVDRPALEIMATQYARAKQAAAVIQAQGHMTRGSAGQMVEHPAMRVEREAAQIFVRFAEQYALTPVARTRLGLAEMQRRSLEQDMEAAFGKPEYEPV